MERPRYAYLPVIKYQYEFDGNIFNGNKLDVSNYYYGLKEAKKVCDKYRRKERLRSTMTPMTLRAA